MSTNARASTPAATAASADEPAAASAATAVATSRPKAAEAAAHGPTAAQPEASTPSSMTAQPTSASSAGNSKRMRAGTHAKGRRRAVIEDHSTEDEADDQGAGRGARSRKRAAASDDDDDQDETSSSSSSSNDEDSDAETGDDDDETACAICGKDYSPAKNCIVLCDGKDCDIPVHQKCYGIDVVPPGDEKWFCQRCEDNVPVDKTNIVCCPERGGALKRTQVPKQYIHAVCALANPSIDVEKNSITVEKWLLDKEKCYICSESKGLTVACSIAACKRWFHVTCGVKEGILDPPSRNVAKSQILCAEHKQKPSRGQTHKRGGAQAGGRTSAAQFNASNSGGNSTSTSSGNSSSSAAKRRRRGNTDKDGNWEAHTSSSDDEDEKGSIDIEMPDADGDETMTPTKAEQASSSSRAGGPGAAAGASGSGASAAGNSTKLKARRSGAGGPLAGSTGNASGTSGAAGQSRPGLGDRRPDDAQDAASGSAQPRVPVRSSGPSPAPGTETRRVEPLGMAKKTSDPVAGNKFGSRPLAANQAIKMTSGDKPWLKESSRASLSSSLNAGTSTGAQDDAAARQGRTSMAPFGSASAGSWLMEKIAAIKSTIAEIESMPPNVRRALGREPPTSGSSAIPGAQHQPATSAAASSPLDSLLDSSYQDLSRIIDERDAEIRMLKQQLQVSQAEVQRLQQDNVRMRSMPASVSQSSLYGDGASAGQPDPTLQLQYAALQDNLEVIFGYLNLPQMPNPTKSDMDAYVSTLRSIIERAKRSGNGGNGANSFVKADPLADSGNGAMFTSALRRSQAES